MIHHTHNNDNDVDMATNDTQADSSHSVALDDKKCVRLMNMVRAHDFAGLRAAVRNHPYLAKAELVAGLGLRLVHQVASIIPTDDELSPYRKLLFTLVGGRQVDNWHAENLMANDFVGRIALHFAAAAGNDEAIKILINSWTVMLA